MSHSYTSLYTHVVFGTKHREPQLLPEMRERLLEYTGGILRNERCSLLAGHAMTDHVHLLVRVHPSLAQADLARIVKSRTSSWVRETFPAAVWDGWQEGYGAFSVSRSGVDAVTEYINRQEEHHRVMIFEKEFLTMLNKHDIEYDPRYVWRG